MESIAVYGSGSLAPGPVVAGLSGLSALPFRTHLQILITMAKNLILFRLLFSAALCLCVLFSSGVLIDAQEGAGFVLGESLISPCQNTISPCQNTISPCQNTISPEMEPRETLIAIAR